MPIARKIPPLPSADIPIIEADTGRVSLAWYQWFTALIAVLNEIRSAIP